MLLYLIFIKLRVSINNLNIYHFDFLGKLKLFILLIYIIITIYVETTITIFSGLRSYLTLHMLQESHFIQRSSTSSDIHICAQSVPICGINRSLLINFIRLTDMLGRYIGPLFGQIDHGARVHQTVAELVGDLSLYTVQYPAGLVAQRLGSRGEYH